MAHLYDEAALSRRDKGKLIVELAKTVKTLKTETNRRAKLPLIKRILEIVKILKGATVANPTVQETTAIQEVATEDTEFTKFTKDKKILIEIKEKKHPLMTSPELRDVISDILKKYNDKKKDASMQEVADDMVNTCMEAIDAWADFVEDYIKTETNGAIS